MKRNLIFIMLALFIIVMVVLLPGCLPGFKNNNNPLPPVQKIFSKLGINGASMLAVLPRIGSNVNDLFMVVQGTLTKVKFFDQNDQEMTPQFNPTAVYQASPEYIILTGTEIGTNTQIGHLVRKSDGAVFSLDNVGLPKEMDDKTRTVQHDGVGNIYYVVNKQVLKVDTQNPAQLNGKLITSSQEEVSDFIIGKEGCLVYYYTSSNSSGYKYLVYNQSTNTYSVGVSYPNVNNLKFWKGLDDTIYGLYGSIIFKYSNTSSPENYRTIENIWINNNDYVIVPMPNNNEIFIITWGDIYPGTKCYEVYKDPRLVFEDTSVISLYMVTKLNALASDNYLYIYTLYALYRYDFNDNMLRNITPASLFDNFDVYSLTLDTDSNNDVFTFNGLRKSDNVVVMGRVDPFGNVTVLDAEHEQAIALIRIN